MGGSAQEGRGHAELIGETLFSPQESLNLTFTRRWTFTLATCAAVLLLVGLASHSVAMLFVGLAAVGVLVWGVRRTLIDPTWLLFGLVLEETLPYLNILPFDPEHRWFIRYPILLALCLPALPNIWRSGILKRGYFSWFLLYFAFAAISVSWSLAPAASAGRLFPNVLLFATLSLAAARVRNEADVQRTIGHFLLACGILVALEFFALLVLPASVAIEGEAVSNGIYTWQQDMAGILRFCGFFGTINTVGSLMVATVGAGLAHWRATVGRRRWALALTMAGSIVLGALADSRSCFIGLTVGIAAYLIWKYGFRAIAMCLAAAVLIFALYSLLNSNGKIYFNRDISTLTGRSYLWQFEFRKLKQEPFTGYGYDVEGAVFEDRYFEEWNKFFNQGPNTTLHEGYLSVALGVGVPATLLWLFIFVAPFVTLFTRKDDPWSLRPMVFFTVIPIMILGIDETGIAEPRYMTGLLIFLFWMLAERQRIAARARQQINRWQFRYGGRVDYQRLLAGASQSLLLLALLFSAQVVRAADYYVANSGNEANRGTSPAVPWRTLAHVNQHVFVNGDVVHLARGSVFRETLRPHGRMLTFVPYGNGAPPTINGADVVTGWSPEGDGYSAPVPQRVYNVFIDGGPGWGLARQQWHWADGRLWLAHNPGGHVVEAVIRPIGIHGYVAAADSDQLDGLVLDGIRIIQTGLRGISLESDRPAPIKGLIVRNCIIERTGTGHFDDGSYGNAITIINAAAPIIENNEISYCGNHGNCINVQQADGARVIANEVAHWNHNGIDIKQSRNVLVEGNTARDQPAVGAGFYTELSSNVVFADDRSIDVSNGFQIGAASTASINDSHIEDAGTCIYFGPNAKSLTLRGNVARGCSSTLEGTSLANVLQQGNSWNRL